MLEMINYEEKLKQHVEDAEARGIKIGEARGKEEGKEEGKLNTLMDIIMGLKQDNPNWTYEYTIKYVKKICSLTDETVSMLRKEFIKN